MNLQRIYLDNAATTPMSPDVARAMLEASKESDFNPSSAHTEGRRARARLDEARDRVAAALGAARTEIVFTAGGTEAVNLAILGTLAAAGQPAHVVASAIEHQAVLASLERLEEDGVTSDLVPVDPQGRVTAAAFEAALRPETRLASIMYANNEVGTLQPVTELAAIARRRGVLFHTDAVAAAAWLPLNVRSLGVDLLSISGHKIHGPRGAGILYVGRGVPLRAETLGGGQEGGRRSGTENVAAAVGLAAALEAMVRERAQTGRVAALRDRLEAGIESSIRGVRFNGRGAERLPNISNVGFEGIEPAAMLVALDLEGIAVSAGSACTSGSIEPSHVLAAMDSNGLRGGIRFSLSSASTADEIERVLSTLPRLVAALRGNG